MMQRKPRPVVLPLSQIAPAFGLTAASLSEYIAVGAPARGDRIEVGAFAAWLARSTMARSHVAA
jgi:hypothetical protein